MRHSSLMRWALCAAVLFVTAPFAISVAAAAPAKSIAIDALGKSSLHKLPASVMESAQLLAGHMAPAPRVARPRVDAAPLAAAAAAAPSPTPPPLPPWTPIDPTTFPPALANDTVDVIFLLSPLLELQFGKLFKIFNIYHSALAFRNQRTNFSWTVNYDAFIFDLSIILLPTISGKNLTWNNFGAAYCYYGINQTYWTQQPVTSINGSLYNRYISQYLMQVNATWPYYVMNRVAPTVAAPPQLDSHECFDFALQSIAWIKSTGGLSFTATIKRNVIVWYSANTPQLVNDTDPTQHQGVVDFYKLVEFKWKSITNIVEFLAALAELALFGEFYVHAFDPSNTAAMNYYRFQLSWPWLGIAYVPVTL